MQKKTRWEPRIDFTDSQTSKWVEIQLEKHPEITRGAIIPAGYFTSEGLRAIRANRQRILSWPGEPITRNKTYKIEDWEAWLIYYSICQLMGLVITPSDIAEKTGKKTNTVNFKFKKAIQKIKEIDI